MLPSKVVDAFQFDNHGIFHDNVAEELSDGFAFVSNWKGRLRDCGQSAQREFPQQSTLIHFLEKPSPKSISDLEDRSENPFRQNCLVFCVHLSLSAAIH